MTEYLDFADKRVLITGGLGFIGSNLAIRLVECGAEVTLLDAMIPGHGGNTFNIDPVKDEVVLNFTKRPGVNVQITVEIHAESAEGFDENLQRTIRENTKTLRFGDSGFEEGE